jgi:hypothetical protein
MGRRFGTVAAATAKFGRKNAKNKPRSKEDSAKVFSLQEVGGTRETRSILKTACRADAGVGSNVAREL